jgi:hypothetical protein
MAFADHDGIEGSAINEFRGDDLIAGTGLSAFLRSLAVSIGIWTSGFTVDLGRLPRKG